MSSAAVVLYAGPAEEAVELAEAFPVTDEPGVVVVPVPDRSRAASVVAGDERPDCLVATGEDGVLTAVREEWPDLPVVAYGVDVAGATLSVGSDADTEPLANHVADLVTASDGADDLATASDGADDLATRMRRRDLQQTTRALEAAPIGISISDPNRADNPLVFVNEAFCDLTGYDREAALGRNCRFLQGEDTDPETVAEMRSAIDAGEPVSVEVLNYRADGRPFWNRLDIAPVHDDAGEVVNFVGFQQEVTDQKRLEDRLRALHEHSSALMAAGNAQDVFETAVETAAEVLGLPLTAVWRYDGRDDRLVPVAWSEAAADLVGDPPAFDAGEGLAWRAFETDTVIPVDDVRETEGAYNPGSSVRSEIIVPMGGEGVIITGSPDPHGFDEIDVDLFRVLATNTAAAVESAEREQALQRQNERLDEFVSVVSHDMRNPLQVATLRLETYRETGNSAHLDGVERAHDRMADLIEDLLELARQGETVDDPEQTLLATVASQAWDAVATPEASLRMASGATLMADPDRLKQLFENLFGNAVDHAGTDVTVTVETTTDGFAVADDGPGIPPEDRDSVFERGYSTAQSGTGFGLGIVERIAEAHGWSVTVTESESGGARFEISGVSTLGETG